MRHFILGTDWGEDCDDAVAVRYLARKHRAGEIELCGIGLNTQSSEYTRAHRLGTAWREDYRRTLERMTELTADIVLGNHPQQTNTFKKYAAKTKEHNPFIDPGEWQRFLSECKERFEQLVKDDPL